MLSRRVYFLCLFSAILMSVSVHVVISVVWIRTCFCLTLLPLVLYSVSVRVCLPLPVSFLFLRSWEWNVSTRGYREFFEAYKHLYIEYFMSDGEYKFTCNTLWRTNLVIYFQHNIPITEHEWPSLNLHPSFSRKLYPLPGTPVFIIRYLYYSL